MELEIPPFPNIFISLTFIFILLKLLRSRRTNLPPGPWQFPLIGSLDHLAVSALEPHHVLKNLARKYGPIMHLQLGENSTVVISAPRLAKEVLKSHNIAFASWPKLLAPEILTYNCFDTAFGPNGCYGRQMRKICTLELLTAKNIRAFSSICEEEALTLIESIKSMLFVPIDLTDKIFTYTNKVVSQPAFGNILTNQEEVIRLISELTTTAGGFHLADLYPSIKILQVISGLKSKLMKLRDESNKVTQLFVSEENIH